MLLVIKFSCVVSMNDLKMGLNGYSLEPSTASSLSSESWRSGSATGYRVAMMILF